MSGFDEVVIENMGTLLIICLVGFIILIIMILITQWLFKRDAKKEKTNVNLPDGDRYTKPTKKDIQNTLQILNGLVKHTNQMLKQQSLAGLTDGIYAARAGHQISVFETYLSKNAIEHGGCNDSFTKEVEDYLNGKIKNIKTADMIELDVVGYYGEIPRNRIIKKVTLENGGKPRVFLQNSIVNS